MDGHRFDELTRMTAGTSRRRALRLLGGGLAAALLAALGRGDRAAAGVFFTNCLDYGATSGPPAITHEPGGTVIFQKLCPACPHPEESVCAALIDPVGHLFCRCLRL